MYRVNHPRIVHETIDGETVLLDLNKGVYFSFDATGVVLWEHLEKFKNFEQLLGLPVWEDAQREEISRFYSQLEDEEIIVSDPGPVTQEDCSYLMEGGQLTFTYTCPVLNKYSDMQDLLLLDPIHEVEKDQGWPKPLNK